MVAALRGRKAVVAKLGMDAHWRGAIVVANALRDAGMEVVYIGHATAEEICRTVVQEDAALLGLSCLSGNHLSECPAVLAELTRAGANDVAVVIGGTIPPADQPALATMGVHAVFPTGSPLTDVIAEVDALLSARAGERRGLHHG